MDLFVVFSPPSWRNTKKPLAFWTPNVFEKNGALPRAVLLRRGDPTLRVWGLRFWSILAPGIGLS